MHFSKWTHQNSDLKKGLIEKARIDTGPFKFLSEGESAATNIATFVKNFELIIPFF